MKELDPLRATNYCKITAIANPKNYQARFAVLIPLPYLKTFTRQINSYDKGDRTYPHRNLPTSNNHLPFQHEPQGVNDRYSEKNCAG
jgi:hypothetical protein